MESIKKAIKHFECVKSDAVAVLDSGFGTKPNESNIVYKKRKLYAELAINALEKQIPKKAIRTTNSNGKYNVAVCPNCEQMLGLYSFAKNFGCCYECGQAIYFEE